MRIRQEILLGIGGLRALQAAGVKPTICHMNEGHSAFLALERIRRLMAEQGYSFATAREASIIGNIFTTHTPVAASNDWFPADLVESHLSHFREALGLSREEFLGLGRIDHNDHHAAFCTTVLALKLSGGANGGQSPARQGQSRNVAGSLARFSRARVPNRPYHEWRAYPHLDGTGNV